MIQRGGASIRDNEGRSTENWIMLVGGWVLLAASVLTEPTPAMNGAHLLGALLLAVGFAASAWHWGASGLGREEWMLLITCLALVATLDFDAVGRRDLVVNTTPLVIVLIPLLRRMMQKA